MLFYLFQHHNSGNISNSKLSLSCHQEIGVFVQAADQHCTAADAGANPARLGLKNG